MKFEDVFIVIVLVFDLNVWVVYMVGVDSGVVSKISEVMVVWGDEDILDFVDLLNEG